ncbi:hypothetical protein [Hymenobacter psychrotolerans]|uniref:Uncharacterized protein n=1 Tax=Hymenobacter psychrotolerans DSM 18569 TaxID=1121959 RepID=A0A1M7E8I7_9BACT|nr:hypothetical protein [Hymenobacter psychrotolerans]SHL88047.1 hypothetical protein SAMN02746009_03552 [Hymenobacter psychrotolerans DSM 18569]
MIRLTCAAGELHLASSAVSLEIGNPYFGFTSVPGITTYPFSIAGTEDTMRKLNFPHLRAAQGQVPAPEPAELYIDGLLWRVGVLVYESFDESKGRGQGVFQYKFLADAADLQSRIDGVSLRSLDLGAVLLQLRYDHADYALPLVRNESFFGDKNPPYNGWLNHFPGQYTPSAESPLVPFPRLIPLLRRVLAAVGYSLSGPWTQEAEALKLIVVSDRALRRGAATVQLNQHVPDMNVGEFLVALQQLLGLGYSFDAVRRELRVTRLRDIVADQAYVHRAGGAARFSPPTAQGYTLEMRLANDELNKTLDTSWSRLLLGAGKEKLGPAAGTLHVGLVADPVRGTELLVPRLEGKGAGEEFELGDDSRLGLLLLLDHGLQPDSGGQPYPLASPLNRNAQGAVVGQSTLHWAGPQGLYAQAHQPWLDFLSAAGKEERTMEFRVSDLLALEPGRKEMVGYRKYLWEKVSLSVPTGRRLESARFTYRNIAL